MSYKIIYFTEDGNEYESDETYDTEYEAEEALENAISDNDEFEGSLVTSGVVARA